MENTKFFLLMICFSTLFIMGCEKTDLHKSDSKTVDRIAPRGDCEQCPDEDECCCEVFLFHTDDADLTLCGTSDGIDACSGEDVCASGSFSGGGASFSLNSIDPTHYAFCMIEGKAFWIQNTSGTGVDLKISCQKDLTNPQILTIHLNNNEKKYYETDEFCELTPCQ